MATMNKPTYNAILTHSPKKPVLVFVSSRRQTRLTGLDLISFCESDEIVAGKPFLWMSEEDIHTVVQRVKDSYLKHTLLFGVGMHHAGLCESDRNIVEELFCNNKIQVLICTSTLAWGVNFPAHLVIIKGTEFFDGKQKRYVDFPITDVLQMMGRAGRPQFDTEAKACIFVHEPKKNFYKKFLYEPFPVESSLMDQMHDHINAEIVGGTVSAPQDCIDYLTWTYFFRRLVMNPSYYQLDDSSEDGVNTFLSTLVHNTLGDLEMAGMIEMDEEEQKIYPTTLGRIASFYYLSFKTLSMFSRNLPPDGDLKTLLQVLCDAAEYDELPVRHNEDVLNTDFSAEVPWQLDTRTMDSPHTKAHLLFQAHFSRIPLPISDYITDTKSVLDQAIRILQAIVDVSAEYGWLYTALQAMHLTQMVIQGRWFSDNTLLTLPHLEDVHVDTLAREGVECLPQLFDLSEDRLRKLLFKCSLNKGAVNEIVRVVGHLPKVDVEVIVPQGSIKAGEDEPDVEVKVVLRRSSSKHGLDVYAPKFNKTKQEGWWLLVGDAMTGELLAMKRLTLKKESKETLLIPPLLETGEQYFQIYLMCDSYLGLDQQYQFSLTGE